MTTAILVHLGLGSNLGNRQALLNQACSKLSAATFQNFRSSEIYESEPLLKMKQSNYFNQVVCGWTELTPVELLEKCQQIETQLGRIRKEHWGSRKIDLDILSYGNQIVDTEKLKIPHPEMEKRFQRTMKRIKENSIFNKNENCPCGNGKTFANCHYQSR